METAFSVWGSDDESELDHGVGGLYPAHQDDRPLNGPSKARERTALITIKNRNSPDTCDARGSSDGKYFQSTDILSKTGSYAQGSSDTKYFQSTEMPSKMPSKTGKKGREAIKSYPTVIPTTLPSETSLLSHAATSQQAWQHSIQTKKLREVPQAQTIFDRERVTRAVKWAISDSGATGHFLIAGAPAVNIKPATKPIAITLPNGKIIKSTHTCNLDIPWLPEHLTEAHIVPGLGHASPVLV